MLHEQITKENVFFVQFFFEIFQMQENENTIVFVNCITNFKSTLLNLDK
jgi:hypothetical protein